MRALVLLIFSLTSATCMAQSSYSDAMTALHKAPLESVLEPDVVVAKPPTIFKADGHAYLRVVDLLWIELAPDTTPFGVLRHTATMRRLDAKSTITLPVAGDTAVESEAVTISPPLKGSNWAALNGPSATSQHRQSMDSYNGQTQFAERFAIDWVQVDEEGQTAHGDRLALKNFLCYASLFTPSQMRP